VQSIVLGTARIPRGVAAPAARLRRNLYNATFTRPASAGALTGDRFPLASEATGVSGVAERYAAALFDLADERHELDAVAADLRELRTMLHQSGDLVRLLRSPVLSREAQGKAIAALVEAAGLTGLTRDFLGVVARNRRLFAVPEMIEAYLRQLAERRGEVTAQVTVAEKLSGKNLDALKDALKSKTGGKDIDLDVRIDPAIIGGLIVKVGSRMVDSSLRTKLNSIRLAMKEAR
jgi:F-type H+-transporting ATPase subunit delta